MLKPTISRHISLVMKQDQPASNEAAMLIKVTNRPVQIT